MPRGPLSSGGRVARCSRRLPARHRNPLATPHQTTNSARQPEDTRPRPSQTSPAGHRRLARPGQRPDAATDITAWVTASDPDITDPPDVLDLDTVTPPRRLRQALDN
jgi:hypothetical protein